MNLKARSLDFLRDQALISESKEKLTSFSVLTFTGESALTSCLFSWLILILNFTSTYFYLIIFHHNVGVFLKMQIHGVLNAVSWGILFPLGVIIARYLRTFPSADPAWFYLHAFCQVSAYAIGVAGWGTGLKLGSESKGIQYSGHRNIGIATFCLATLQVKPRLILF